MGAGMKANTSVEPHEAAAGATGALRTLTVTVGLPDRKLCGNAAGPSSRAGHIARNRRIKAQREAAYWSGLDAIARFPLNEVGRGKPYFPTGRVLVTVAVHRDPLWATRKLDDDNLIRGMKSQIDGLTDANIWTDDQQVRWGVITWQAAEPYRGCLVLTLTQEETA